MEIQKSKLKFEYTDEFGNVTKAEPAEVKTTSKVMTLTK